MNTWHNFSRGKNVRGCRNDFLHGGGGGGGGPKID